ncbi:MAG: ribonuclease P protein component [Chlorobiaceae bacterium]|jgi:ribonuclease P protein component|nr:ribonuclease P protein component [Chlorobiaceae bacterium]
MSSRHVNSLRKHEILRKEQLISGLFESGKSLKGDYLKFFYRVTESDVNGRAPAAMVLFAVSKKAVPHAVSRNKLKRLMREAYRHEKHQLFGLHADGSSELCRNHLHIALLYIGGKKSFPSFELLRQEISRLLHNIRLSELT